MRHPLYTPFIILYTWIVHTEHSNASLSVRFMSMCGLFFLRKMRDVHKQRTSEWRFFRESMYVCVCVFFYTRPLCRFDRKIIANIFIDNRVVWYKCMVQLWICAHVAIPKEIRLHLYCTRSESVWPNAMERENKKIAVIFIRHRHYNCMDVRFFAIDSLSLIRREYEQTCCRWVNRYLHTHNQTLFDMLKLNSFRDYISFIAWLSCMLLLFLL